MKSISPQELKNWIDSGKPLQLIDVRETHEYKLVHIERAVHIPLRNIMNSADTVDKKIPAVVYCHHGSRSQLACMILSQKGFSELINLEGGIHAYALDADRTLKTY